MNNIDIKTPLSIDQLIDLTTEAVKFVRAMQDAHPREHTTATLTTSGVSINFGSTRSVRFERGVYAYQTIAEAKAQLDTICESEGWTPRLNLPEWAKA